MNGGVVTAWAMGHGPASRANSEYLAGRHMPAVLRNQWLIAWTIFIESVRRREIYVVVGAALLMIASLRFVQFFEIEGLGKFYREVALMVMNWATGLTVVVLAARQLPREFRNRTLYPLLAKPVSRLEFLLGKFAGVMAAAAFCYGLFMVIFVMANWQLGTSYNEVMFAQSIYLQLLGLAVMASMAFLLSILVNTDAAITLGVVLYAGSQFLMSSITFVYYDVPPAQQLVMRAMVWGMPHLTLFDASQRVVHGDNWPAVETHIMAMATGYGLFWVVLFLGATYLIFRRRTL